jgi:3-phenylpropionate/trans-cinnamate dioxygenase ferredoxin reductase subunit
MTHGKIVIVGGGHAAAQLCISLAEMGFGGDLVLISEEPVAPYHRPPLSKGYLKNSQDSVQLIRGIDWYKEQGIQLLLGTRVEKVLRDERKLILSHNEVLDYERLVIATGTSARQFPGIPAGTRHVLSLRTQQDADVIRAELGSAQDILIVGGGFIGLEFAATAASIGNRVVVAETASRLMARAVSPQLSEHALLNQRGLGVEVCLSATVSDPTIEHGVFKSIRINGQEREFSWLLLAMGATPNDALAKDCGLQCDNGIVVDAYMRTSDLNILAIGDCARFSMDGRRGLPESLRLESIQNANDQAKCAALTLTGTLTPYKALPWFWSEQGQTRFQMAGLLTDNVVRHEEVNGSSSSSRSIHHYDDEGHLVCVESINFPADHMKSKKLLADRW